MSGLTLDTRELGQVIHHSLTRQDVIINEWDLILAQDRHSRQRHM
jgi:hypothetical protein